MPYGVKLMPGARRGLEAVPEDVRERVAEALRRLSDNPRPPGCRKVESRDPLWRIHVGRYRGIYTVFDKDRLVVVVRVSKRGERTYKGL